MYRYVHYLNWIWYVNAAGYFWRACAVWLRLLRGMKLKTPVSQWVLRRRCLLGHGTGEF